MIIVFPKKTFLIDLDEALKIPLIKEIYTMKKENNENLETIKLEFGENAFEYILLTSSKAFPKEKNIFPKKSKHKLTYDEQKINDIYKELLYFQMPTGSNNFDLEDFFYEVRKLIKEEHCRKVEEFFEELIYEKIMGVKTFFKNSFIDWNRLCTNTSLPESFFEKYGSFVKEEFQINYLLFNNSNLSESFFEKLISSNMDFVNWCGLCQNENMSEEFFEKHFDKINWNSLCYNQNISEEFYVKHMDEMKTQSYPIYDFWCALSKNPNLSGSFFEKYAEYTSWYELSNNPNISEDFFDKYITNFRNENKDDFADSLICYLCSNPNISESFFERHIQNFNDFEQPYIELCRNTNISESFIEKHFDLTDKICLDYIFEKPNISESFVRKHLSSIKQINWFDLCEYAHLPESFFEEFLDNINWWSLCKNTNISEEFFEKHIDKVDWWILCRNKNISVSFFC